MPACELEYLRLNAAQRAKGEEGGTDGDDSNKKPAARKGRSKAKTKAKGSAK